ncbi:hypothetical protein [Lederbergia galactosidilytica]|uniref:Phage portal protein n=1 Tax=Lederbergia galactosidilytica TaxID=217031 RepID=A0A177ZQ45_9BACI|nr:hypothetical protein [Lederbergia galactosidilytica]OAK70087.1 hypothetical protein ABB05_12970 [Lederbergia galactosidilytica]
MTINWTKFDEEVIKKTHGKIYFYRDLYEGNHANLFSRAKDLIEKGEIVDEIIYGTQKSQNVKTPYIIANISKLIPEIPAMLVSRSIGNIQTSISSEEYDIPEDDRPDDENYDLLTTQQEVIRDIESNSHLEFEHWGNIVQQQVDGGLVGVPWLDERGLRIEFKSRDVYYPHEDGLGVDLVYDREIDGDEYLHVYRERVEDGSLVTRHYLYEINDQRETKQLPDEVAKEILGMDELGAIYKNRERPFIVYWPNEKTFMNPLGVSSLKNQESKQDEINWTLTRNAITFERNGKPRIAVTTEIMQALQDKALERYGDESKIDHRDLEITTFDEHGRALEVIQIDVTKIGDIQWVKDLIKMMLMETKTSEKAIDFYLDTRSTAQQSGVAKFYDLFISLLKAEQLQKEYIYFLKQLIESALWLAKEEDSSIIIEQPEIQLKAMIPISRKELLEENSLAYEKGTQSLEVTIRRNNPTASEEWIQEELARVEQEKQGDDSSSLLTGRSTLNNFMDNRSSDDE